MVIVATIFSPTSDFFVPIATVKQTHTLAAIGGQNQRYVGIVRPLSVALPQDAIPVLERYIVYSKERWSDPIGRDY